MSGHSSGDVGASLAAAAAEVGCRRGGATMAIGYRPDHISDWCCDAPVWRPCRPPLKRSAGNSLTCAN